MWVGYKRRPKDVLGFTLMEAVVVFFALSLITTGIFVLFRFGSGTFHHLVLKQGLQVDATRFSHGFSRLARLTHFDTVTVIPRTYVTSDGDTVRRDAVAFVGLSSWSSPSSFDPYTGLPLWDEYVVYYATTDGDQARLIRQIVSPGGTLGISTYADLGANIDNNPANNADVVNTLEVTDALYSFEVTKDSSDRTVKVRLRLRRKGARSGLGNRLVDESFEADYAVPALNTFPDF